MRITTASAPRKVYWYWIRFYLRFHQMRHPLELGPAKVNQFLSWLASERQVAAATQNLVLNAIVFLYARVLERPLGDIGETIRAKRPPRLLVMLSHQEAKAIQTLLGHANVRTTQIYTHVLGQGFAGVHSPLR